MGQACKDAVRTLPPPPQIGDIVKLRTSADSGELPNTETRHLADAVELRCESLERETEPSPHAPHELEALTKSGK